MGRTIPTSTMLLRMEQQDWKAFRKQLPKKDRKLFDEMFDLAHIYNYAMVMSIPRHPIRIQPILMSMVYHYRQLIKIMEGLDEEAA